MALLSSSKPKLWALKEFVAAAEHEHAISADTVMLRHTGDFIRISVKQQPTVSSIRIIVKKRTKSHMTDVVLGIHIDPQDTATSESVVIDSAKDYEVKLKEQFEDTSLKDARYIDDVDYTITLYSVTRMDGSVEGAGQDPTAPGPLWVGDVLTALGWVLGGLALIMAAYVGYRVWRHYRHGDVMFPRLQKLVGGGDE